MPTDPRAALTALVAALERHLEAAAARRGENDPVVLAAYRALADAFEDYDDALLDAFDEVTPLEVFHGDDGDDGDDDGDDGDDGDDDGDDGDDEDFDEEFDGPDEPVSGYTGLDDEEYEDESDVKSDGPGPVRAT